MELDFKSFIKNNIEQAETIIDTFIKLTQNSYAYIEDMSTHVTWWSKAAQEMLGFEQRYEEDAFRHALERVHGDDRADYINGYTMRIYENENNSRLMYRVKTKDNGYHFFAAETEMIMDETGKPLYFLALLKDINIHPEFDALTDLMSQSMYKKMVNQKIANKEKFAILRIGIDKFANLNMAYGVAFGDKVLREIAYQFMLLCDGKYMVYRLEGAKFAFVFQNATREELTDFDEKVRMILTHEFLVGGQSITLKVTSGAILVDASAENIDSETVQGNVTYAARQSKLSAQGGLIIFNDLIKTQNTMNLEIIRVVHEAVRKGCDGFYVVYQPIVTSADGKISGAESLVRWKKEPYGNVPPGMFIEWLENDPTMYDLGAFVLKTALTDGKRFIELVPEFILNVNISIRQLERKEFRQLVVDLLKETGFPADHLCLELTERCKGLDISFLAQETIFFQSLGIRVAMDDYGTGSAATSIVMQVPVNEIKIDMSFIRGIEQNQKKKSMVKGIVEFANENGMYSCIEGVENEEVQDFLRTYNATWFQGYFYSKPISADELIDYIKQN